MTFLVLFLDLLFISPLGRNISSEEPPVSRVSTSQMISVRSSDFTKKGTIYMMKIKLTILAILASMYGIALSENGIVQTISWVLFIGLSLTLFALLEKRYELD